MKSRSRYEQRFHSRLRPLPCRQDGVHTPRTNLCRAAPLPRHRAVTLQPEHQGALFLQEAYDPELRRNVRRAHLRAAGVDAVPALRDAVVTWIGDKSLTVIGIETDPLTRKCVAQAWYSEFGATALEARQ